MAIMTPEEKLAWVKVQNAVYVLGGYIMAKRGRIRLTCAVDDLPDDEMALKIKDMAERQERTHLVVDVDPGAVHVNFRLADDLAKDEI